MNGTMRNIFSATVLALWILFGVGMASGTWTATQWLLLTIGHICCLVIWLQFTWVFNYGYALTMIANSAAVMVLHPSVPGLVVGALTAVFGLRLLQFTHARYSSAQYLSSAGRQRRAVGEMPVVAKAMLWLFVAWLMGFELMALYFIAVSGALSATLWVGAALMLAGLVLETVADRQKQAAKARSPESCVMDGLYARIRHPNYLGEILFQAGLIICAAGALDGWWQWAVGVAAPCYIIVLMVWSAHSQDDSQQSRYGQDPAWQRYRASSGSLLPWV